MANKFTKKDIDELIVKVNKAEENLHSKISIFEEAEKEKDKAFKAYTKAHQEFARAVTAYKSDF